VNAEKKMSQTISNKLELKIAILNSQQNIRRIFVSIAQKLVTFCNLQGLFRGVFRVRFGRLHKKYRKSLSFI
jgi:hypothetical protein